MSLLDRTEKLLRYHVNRGMSLREIAATSGETVELQWLYRFARGEIENPGVNSVESLHAHLENLKQKNAA